MAVADGGETEECISPANRLPVLLALPCVQVVEHWGSVGGDAEEASVSLRLTPNEARVLAVKLVEAARVAEGVQAQGQACPGCGKAVCEQQCGTVAWCH